MIEQTNNQLQLVIPLQGIQQLYAYQKGLLGLLNEIELDKCNSSKKKDIQRVYELLGHLYQDSQDLVSYPPSNG